MIPHYHADTHRICRNEVHRRKSGCPQRPIFESAFTRLIQRTATVTKGSIEYEYRDAEYEYEDMPEQMGT